MVGADVAKCIFSVVWSLVMLGAPAAHAYTIQPFEALAVYPEHRVAAQVRALDEARVSAQVAGRILALPVRVGEVVSKGSLLARLDDTDYRIALTQAQAQLGLFEARLALSQAQLEQAQGLAARGFASADALRIRETELAVVRSELAVARETLKVAQVNLGRTELRAPFDGVVRARHASLGDQAQPGQPVITLASSADSEIHASVPASRVAGLLKSAHIHFWVEGEAHAVQIVRVMPLVEAAGQVQLVVLGSAAALPPGRAGELRWTDPVPHLPASYVLEYAGQRGVWIELAGAPVFQALPHAQPGRPVALDWPLEQPVVDQGRLTLGVPMATRQLAAEE